VPVPSKVPVADQCTAAWSPSAVTDAAPLGVS
jgi:hypothetical protein